MIIFAAPFVALTPPPADIAVADRLGIVCESERCRVLFDRGLQPLANEPIERGEVGDTEGLNGIDRIWCDDVEPLGQSFLDSLEEIRVERQLEDRGAARFPRELRVVDLVGPRAENARRFDSAQNVGKPQPFAVAEDPLRDGRLALAHGFEATLGGLGTGESAEIEILVTFGRDRFDVLLLVRQPSLHEHVQEGVGVIRLLSNALRHLHVQRGAMLTREEAAEIGGGELED